MLSQEKLHKVSKYALRLEKSFIKNNSSDYLKYCSHLKYHIGGDNTQVDEMFKKLINFINSNDKYKFETLQTTNDELIKEKETLKATNDELIEQIEKCRLDNTKLQEEHKRANDKIQELNNNNEELKTENSTLKEKITKYKGIIEMINSKLFDMKNIDNDTIDDDNYKTELNKALDEIKSRLEEKETMCKTNDEQIKENYIKIEEQQNEITRLNEKIKEQETTINDLQTQLNKSNQEKDDLNNVFEQSKLVNAKELEELKKNNYTEFKSQLSNLFNAIYPKPIANDIIQQMEVRTNVESKKEVAEEQKKEVRLDEKAKEEKVVKNVETSKNDASIKNTFAEIIENTLSNKTDENQNNKQQNKKINKQKKNSTSNK